MSLFKSPVAYDTGANTDPMDVTIIDVNGDGKADIVTVNNSNTVSVLIGNGDGTFQAPIQYAAGASGSFPHHVAAGDLNGDGRADLVITDTGRNTVSVLLATAAGTFPTYTQYTVGAYPSDLVLADLNNDGRLDIVATNQNSTHLSVRLGNGNGTFQSQISVPTTQTTTGVGAGDFNGDGFVDLAVNNYGANGMQVLLGQGNGTFTSGSLYSAGAAPIGVATGDLNGDGKLDVAVANRNSQTTSVYFGKGDGTFHPQVALTVGMQYSSTIADLNGDGIGDLVTRLVGGSLNVQFGSTAGTFTQGGTFATARDGLAFAVGDLDGDGRMDLVATDPDWTAGSTASSVSVFLQEAPPRT